MHFSLILSLLASISAALGAAINPTAPETNTRQDVPPTELTNPEMPMTHQTNMNVPNAEPMPMRPDEATVAFPMGGYGGMGYGSYSGGYGGGYSGSYGGYGKKKSPPPKKGYGGYGLEAGAAAEPSTNNNEASIAVPIGGMRYGGMGYSGGYGSYGSYGGYGKKKAPPKKKGY
ncbi:hypothetical protein HDU76_013103, partial [Blyttiomyces sp. JEL0837]